MTDVGKVFVAEKPKKNKIDHKTVFYIFASLVVVGLLSGCVVLLMQMRHDFKTTIEDIEHQDEIRNMANQIEEIVRPEFSHSLERERRWILVNEAESSITEENDISTDSYVDMCEMGMGSYYISDAQISASSDYTSHFNGRFGRLDATANDVYYLGNSYGAWLPTGKKLNEEWLQVDLIKPQLVAGIVTQGRPKHYPQWVTSFKISCGKSASQMEIITDENGDEKIFEGNVDGNSKVVNMFPKEMMCQYVRFHPVTWNGTVALRMELLGGDCADMKHKNKEEEVKDKQPKEESPKHPRKLVEAIMGSCAMGMASFDIQESQINTSSDYSPWTNGRYGRLEAESQDPYYWGSRAAWLPEKPYDKQWIEINFWSPTSVAGILTQGRPHDYEQWVTSFKISCGNSTDKLKVITDKDGNEMIFQGNRNKNKKVLNVFPEEMVCQYIRFHPVTWYGAVGLRMETLRGNCEVMKYARDGGCEDEEDPKTCVTQVEMKRKFMASEKRMNKIVKKCGMGMKDHRITDDQINATSDYTPEFDGQHARLDAYTANLYFLGDTYGCWMPTGEPLTDEWLQVDLMESMYVGGIITQGRPKHYEQWITSFKISCGDSLGDMNKITDSDGEDKIFQGNTDRDSKVVNLFPEGTMCRYVMVHPQTSHGTPALRFELLRGGCKQLKKVPLLL